MVEEEYKDSLTKIDLGGPTYFAPCFEMVNEFTKSMKVDQDNQQYNIFLMVTDGELVDPDETLEQLVKGCEGPLSVIVVGVGNANFDKLDSFKKAD